MVRHSPLALSVASCGLNTGNEETAPEISDDGQTLFFSTDRLGGPGGFDIWVLVAS